MTLKIVCLPGDGIGPEVMEIAHLLLDVVSKRSEVQIEVSEYPVGQKAIDETGDPLPSETLEAALDSDAVLLGAVGGRDGTWPESAVLELRKKMDVFANLRPVRAVQGVVTSFRPEVVEGTDILFLRESTAGAYFGEPKGPVEGKMRAAVDTTYYDEAQIERAARLAFRLAQDRRSSLTSVDKANVMATSRLWRDVVNEVATDFADVKLEHLLVDAASYLLIQQPQRFDVVLTENLFGDILSDEAGALVGSLGLLGSATIADSGPGLFEPVHGTAPDIAGRGIANPLGMARTVALMFKYGLEMASESLALDESIDRILVQGPVTPDLNPDSNAGTKQVSEALAADFESRL